jgi:rubrerythrin
MVSKTGLQNDFLDAVSDLIELDYDAIEAYNVAIDKVENSIYREKLKKFREDHKRHVQDFSEFLKRHGKTAPSGPSGKQWLTKGKVALANFLGDNTILKAMASNEIDTKEAYTRMQSREDKFADAKEIIKKGLDDETTHKMWLDEVIEKLNF